MPFSSRETRRSAADAVLAAVLVIVPAVLLWVVLPTRYTWDNTQWDEMAFHIANGARPYVDVYDNKDPGFLVVLGLAAKAFGSWGLALLFLLARLVTAALPALALLSKERRIGAAVYSSVAMAVLLAPGFNQADGLPNVLSASLVLTALVAATFDRWRMAGAIAAFIPFVSLTQGPALLLAGLAGWLLLPRLRDELRSLFLASAVTGLVLLAGLGVWGVLPGWIAVTRENVRYSKDSTWILQGPEATHLSIFRQQVEWLSGDDRRFLLVSLIAWLVLVIVWAVRLRTSKRRLAVVALVGFTAMLISMFGMFLWLHHLQRLLGWMFVLLFAVLGGAKAIKGRPRMAIVAAAGVVALGVGAFVAVPVEQRTWAKAYGEQQTLPDGWRTALADAKTYAYLTENRGFLGRQLPNTMRLACADLADYPWRYERLQEHVDCLLRADVVFTQPLGYLQGGGDDPHPAWVDYSMVMTEAESRLSEEFTALDGEYLGFTMRVRNTE